jgi:hypothetical protein
MPQIIDGKLAADTRGREAEGVVEDAEVARESDQGMSGV